MSRSALVLFLLLIGAGPAAAHFTILLPAAATASRGQAVTVLVRWGHPFEHELFDAVPPRSFAVVAPDGTRTDLLPRLEKDPNLTKAAGYRVRFTPEQRGDYTFVLVSPPRWLEEDEEFVQDTAKVVLHVQAQKGWDAAAGEAFELVPLTRPYGWPAGTVFQAQARLEGRPLAGALVEVERYNAAPPKELPPEEQITRTVKTDPNGVLTCTLTEPGWWCVTAQHVAGKQERNGQAYPVRRRSMLWVFVGGAVQTDK